jgi:hypothetical protein
MSGESFFSPLLGISIVLAIVLLLAAVVFYYVLAEQWVMFADHPIARVLRIIVFALGCAWVVVTYVLPNLKHVGM